PGRRHHPDQRQQRARRGLRAAAARCRDRGPGADHRSVATVVTVVTVRADRSARNRSGRAADRRAGRGPHRGRGTRHPGLGEHRAADRARRRAEQRLRPRRHRRFAVRALGTRHRRHQLGRRVLDRPRHGRLARRAVRRRRARPGGGRRLRAGTRGGRLPDRTGHRDLAGLGRHALDRPRHDHRGRDDGPDRRPHPGPGLHGPEPGAVRRRRDQPRRRGAAPVHGPAAPAHGLHRHRGRQRPGAHDGGPARRAGPAPPDRHDAPAAAQDAARRVAAHRGARVADRDPRRRPRRARCQRRAAAWAGTRGRPDDVRPAQPRRPRDGRGRHHRDGGVGRPPGHRV
ncbi:MAG: ABC transporter, fused permease protein, partial [uncultured Corynebacteriales bacterium]